MPHSNLFPIEDYPSLRGIDVLVEGKPYMYPIYSHIHTKNRNNPLHTWLFSIIQKALLAQINKQNLL